MLIIGYIDTIHNNPHTHLVVGYLTRVPRLASPENYENSYFFATRNIQLGSDVIAQSQSHITAHPPILQIGANDLPLHAATCISDCYNLVKHYI